MNKPYVITPLLLTLAFGGVYFVHRQDAAEQAAVAAAEAGRAAALEITKKAEAERQAREDAERRAQERLAEEKRKEDEKRAKWQAAGRQIEDETTGYQEQAAKIRAEIEGLEAKLEAIRAEKEKISLLVFEKAQAAEAARIAKRNAELEIQRLVEMVARRAGATFGGTTVAKP